VKQPFVKIIRTQKSNYAYDVNTGNILRVSPVVAEILENWEHWSKSVHFLRGDHQKAFRFIKELQTRDGLFLSDRPQCIHPNLSIKNLVTDDFSICSHIILNVTESCNFNCRYCIYSELYKDRRFHSRKSMPWNIAQKAIDLLAKTSRKLNERVFLGFYGGEPLLRFAFIQQCVEYAKRQLDDHPYLFSITTNGSLLSDEIVDYLVENRFVITVSLDGPEEIHNKNRHFADGQGTFRQVIQGVEKLRQRGGNDYFKDYVNLSAVLSPPYNLEPLHNFFANYPSWVRLSSLEYKPELYKDMMIHKANGWQRLAKAIKNHCLSQNKSRDFRLAGLSLPYELFCRELRRIHNRNVEPLQNSCRVLGLCQPGRARAFVSCEGKIYVCERVEGNENMLIGNVDIGIDKRRVLQILKDISGLDFSHCQDCWIIRMCRMCFAHIVYKSQYSIEKWQVSCENLRNHYASAFKLYCEIMEEDETALDFLTSKSAQYVTPPEV